MAEVPLPTPTQAPVPSTDIRNAVFAGAKLDEEVTGSGEFYTDRLGIKRLTNTGRNNQFNAAQQERADQFQQFLLSSGYVFLGDYEDGPFQFSARNQYIRYNDQYYRLNATTDVGFTTTGTDAISFANDVAHFVLMDGDTLRQNLGSGEGFKYIGQVRSAAVLALLPGTNGDRVLLASYHELTAAEMPIGGGEFYYVSSLAGVNNGVTIFNGWCRKIINKTLTTYDAGLKPGDGSNASARLQALADVLRGTSGFTLVGSGTHQVDRPIRFEGASFLKITGDFTVSAAERRDNWQHQGWDNDELPDAVLYFKNCPYLSIPRTVEVVGAKSWYRDYNPAQTYEMGDCGIRLYRCPHSYI
ncbi:hypothetical protein INS53_18285, partial [Raoultella ornithinolytica]|nr:hypothetical protein [Raoultella ornithinolytica]